MLYLKDNRMDMEYYGERGYALAYRRYSKDYIDEELIKRVRVMEK